MAIEPASALAHEPIFALSLKKWAVNRRTARRPPLPKISVSLTGRLLVALQSKSVINTRRLRRSVAVSLPIKSCCKAKVHGLANFSTLFVLAIPKTPAWQREEQSNLQRRQIALVILPRNLEQERNQKLTGVYRHQTRYSYYFVLTLQCQQEQMAYLEKWKSRPSCSDHQGCTL